MVANCWLSREACGPATVAFPTVSRRQSSDRRSAVRLGRRVFTVGAAVPVARQVPDWETPSVPARIELLAACGSGYWRVRTVSARCRCRVTPLPRVVGRSPSPWGRVTTVTSGCLRYPLTRQRRVWSSCHQRTCVSLPRRGGEDELAVSPDLIASRQHERGEEGDSDRQRLDNCERRQLQADDQNRPKSDQCEPAAPSGPRGAKRAGRPAVLLELSNSRLKRHRLYVSVVADDLQRLHLREVCLVERIVDALADTIWGRAGVAGDAGGV